MTRGRATTLVMVMLVMAGCTQNAAPPRDPGKVGLPVKQGDVPGRLYATKGRSLYRFSGSHPTKLLAGIKGEDPAGEGGGAPPALCPPPGPGAPARAAG